MVGIEQFHRQVMPSCAALRHALKLVQAIEPEIVAPQHGTLLANPAEIELVSKRLYALNDVGIDGVLMGMEP
ncbi:MAG: hypothetical protein HQL97_16125 [Magnetococcales bacterium]|nr:hypothetical protein [Magnetococcales bacterium]